MARVHGGLLLCFDVLWFWYRLLFWLRQGLKYYWAIESEHLEKRLHVDEIREQVQVDNDQNPCAVDLGQPGLLGRREQFVASRHLLSIRFYRPTNCDKFLRLDEGDVIRPGDIPLENSEELWNIGVNDGYINVKKWFVQNATVLQFSEVATEPLHLLCALSLSEFNAITLDAAECDVRRAGDDLLLLFQVPEQLRQERRLVLEGLRGGVIGEAAEEVLDRLGCHHRRLPYENFGQAGRPQQP
jgi:hypothetical protein